MWFLLNSCSCDGKLSALAVNVCVYEQIPIRHRQGLETFDRSFKCRQSAASHHASDHLQLKDTALRSIASDSRFLKTSDHLHVEPHWSGGLHMLLEAWINIQWVCKRVSWYCSTFARHSEQSGSIKEVKKCRSYLMKTILTCRRLIYHTFKTESEPKLL